MLSFSSLILQLFCRHLQRPRHRRSLKRWCDATVVKQGEAARVKLPECQTQPAAVTWTRTRCLFTCAAGCWRLLCSAASSSGAGCDWVRGPRRDLVALSRPFIPFRPTPGRTPRTGRPGWTGVSPWLAGKLRGPCACCQ